MSNPITHLETVDFNKWHIRQVKVVNDRYPNHEKHIPNLDDEVTDPDVGLYRVIAVDNDGVCTLERILRYGESTIIASDDESLVTSLLGPDPSAAALLFINKNTQPYTVSIDPSYIVAGAERTKMRFFIGTDTSENGRVISGNFNAADDLVSDEVALISIDPTNPEQKRPAVFQTTEDLQHGALVTGVCYDAAGGPTGKRPFLVEVSGHYLSGAASTRYLQDIRLKSSLIHGNDSDLIENTHGVPLTTTDFMCELIYNDGHTVETSIDGVKVKLHNLDGFDSSYLGSPRTVTLVYYPDEGEPFVNGGTVPRPHIPKTYKLLNRKFNTADQLKIYLVPVYADEITGYTFRYFLTNLAGDLALEVPESVITMRQVNGDPVNPVNYGLMQDVRISLSLDEVAPGAYPGHVHTQSLNLMLNIPGSVGSEPYTIDYLQDNSNPYGDGLRASVNNTGNGIVNLANGMVGEQLWLAKLYASILPMFDNELQNEPTAPTHFELIHGEVSVVVPVADFAADIQMPVGSAPFSGNDTVYMKWINRINGTDHVLGWSPMLTRVDL